ncbi:MAG: beta-galactosidase trimerization domain-containing protein [Treponema sp.]|jgi:hypothetical protein|nr:beta-galactosidase trimerization domain-containing protein [Treponema sp.]
MADLPYRQIHLDFHTSPLIPDVGSRFNAEEFARTLKKNHVNSINLFAKCHHGFYYYPAAAGKTHPSLAGGLDLLGEQMAACRRKGIRAVVYTTVVWAENTCDEHPQWMQIDRNGVLGSRPPFLNDYNTETRAWRSLCMNNPGYVDYLKREWKEIHERFHPDGLWIDIIFQFGCICPHCMAEMKQMNLDPQNPDDVLSHDRHVEIKFSREMYRYLKDMDRNWGIYFNGCPAEFDEQNDTALSTARRRECDDFIDIESLPSELWGYTHFPVLINYCNRFDKPVTMMNGKFHKTWGDFGTLRNPAALEYECFRALANGAGSCVGDQLHPAGKLDETVYDRIGRVFEQIEKKEPWCVNTKKISQIAVYAANRVLENERGFDATAMTINGTNEGVYRMLSELHYLFDFVDFEDDISRYDLVILPDSVRLSPETAARISAYLAAGGKLLLTGESGLGTDGEGFALPELGLKHEGAEEYSPAYAALRPDQNIFRKIPPMDYAVYERGQRVDSGGNRVSAFLTLPYFNRTWEHFCSHRQTPPRAEPSRHPFAVEGNGFIYITHPLFRDYALNGCKVHRDIISGALEHLVAKPLVRGELPSTLEVTLRRRKGGMVLHLLHYIPMKRCKTVEIIEDVIPLYSLDLSLRADVTPVKAYLAPDEKILDFTIRDGYIHCTVPEVRGHQMAVFE